MSHKSLRNGLPNKTKQQIRSKKRTEIGELLLVKLAIKRIGGMQFAKEKQKKNGPDTNDGDYKMCNLSGGWWRYRFQISLLR